MPYVNPEDQRSYTAAWRRRNKRKCAAYNKKYYVANTERTSKRIRQYKETVRGRCCLLIRQIRMRGKTYGITIDYLCSLYAKQQGRCAISGIKMIVIGARSAEVYLNNMSIDRIDPIRGYVVGNVRLVTFQANSAKYTGTDRQLLEFCKAVVNHATT